MDKELIINAIQAVKETAKERKFTESLDLIINLKGLNLKKEDEKILAFLPLPHDRGKKVTVTALVGSELSTKAKEACTNVILDTEFKGQDKKKIKRLAEKTDYFVAQATIMPKVAATFGRVLGPRGRMPNPKAGCVVPPTADLKPLMERLQTLVKLETKNEQVVKVCLGKASTDDALLAENAMVVYNYIIGHVPQEKNNIKNVLIKSSMGKPVVVGKEAKGAKKK